MKYLAGLLVLLSLAGCSGIRWASQDDVDGLRSRANMTDIELRDIEQSFQEQISHDVHRLSMRILVMENKRSAADIEGELAALHTAIGDAISDGAPSDELESLTARQSFLTELLAHVQDKQ